jgi:putative tryptophan/tyrosine transport system substrate-binding protein
MSVRRREFIAFASGAAAWPLLVRAQEAGRTYRLGSLHQSPRNAPHHIAFFLQLQRVGFIEGQNLLVDTHGYGLHVEQLSEHAAKVVKAGVDVIVCGGDLAARAAQHATKTIPILVITDDMFGSRLVGSLAKPEGNTTGVSILATELDAKRQEILIEAVSGIRRMAALADSNTTASRQLQALQEAALARGVELLIHRVAKPEEIAGAIETAKGSGAAALNVLSTALFFNNREIIFERVAALRLPTMYQWPENAEEGGLIGYGPRLAQLYRDIMARLLVKLLLGAKPADLPVEQPTKFELIINLKTARALGLTVPHGLLSRADELIDS